MRGPRGSATRTLTIVGGADKLALTPPLGWNSWNAWGTSVDADKVKAAADWMVKTGLAAHGFQYINIDDGWEGEAWKWAGSIGGNLWRTTGDLMDSWSNLESVGFRQAGREQYAGPGRWNDTDMLVVGSVGWGPDLRPSRLTKNEQILHITLWAMQAAPLLIGADLSKLDEFTIALLTNDEVLDVDQDPLGNAGGRVWKEEKLEVWARPLADGTTAVALFNRGLKPYDVTVRWADIGLRGRQPVRDLWLRKELGEFADAFTATVPRHGAVMIKVGR